MLFLNPGVLQKGLPVLGVEYGTELIPEGSSFVPVDTPAADGETQIPGVNIVPKAKNNPGQIWRGTPNIGMDNEDILEELGISKEIVEKMYAEGKLGKRDYFETK